MAPALTPGPGTSSGVAGRAGQASRRGPGAWWRRSTWLLAAALSLAALVRLPPLAGQSLWSDEFFSLAMATGHSVEHPAASARPELGDYVEPATAVAAGELARYLAHDTPAAGPRRVLRAVVLSDLSPPLYYLLLWAWTLLFGTADAALRSFSLVASLATLPLLPGVARRCGGRRAVLPALALFALAPTAVHHASEGRMYALAGLLAAAQLAATLALHRRGGARRRRWAMWIALAAAGLLTHYFFLFPLAACALWLLAQRGRLPSREVALATVAVGSLVAPWYLRLPEQAAQWRLSAGWLDGFPPAAAATRAPLQLAASFVSGLGAWGGALRFERALLLVFAAVGVALVVALLRRRQRLAVLLPALAAGAACLGPLLVDATQQTHVSLIARYALAGLPAGLVVAACSFARLPRALAALGLIAVAALWSPALRAIAGNPHRMGQSHGALAALLDSSLGREDLLVVHSIPTATAGLASELRGPAPVLSWVEQLGVRQSPRDIARAAAGRRRVACVALHTLDAATPACDWLAAHAVELRTTRVASATVRIFAAPDGGRFPAP